MHRYVQLGAVIAFLAGLLGVGGSYVDTLHNAYLGYFFDKITFLVGCL